MGYFSYCCNSCGDHEQFDCVSNCIVKVTLTDSSNICVKATYDGGGYVNIRVKDTADIHSIPLVQFSEFFDAWGTKITTVADEIYCNGSVMDIPVDECSTCYTYDSDDDNDNGDGDNGDGDNGDGYEHSHQEIIRHCFCGKYRTWLTPEEISNIKPYIKINAP